MEKQLTSKGYLLGKDLEGNMVYLVKSSWDCGWYWGFGYVQGYENNRKRDFNYHTHFDRLFLSGNIHTSFKDYFEETTLNDEEIWKLLELMKTFYTLKESAGLFGRGSSGITKNPATDVLVNKKLVENINHHLLPYVFEKIDELLTKNVK